MTTTWKLAVDWDRDGDYDKSENNTTPYLLKANWFLGFKEPYQNKSFESLMVLVLRNTDQRFSPENTESPIYGKLCPQAPVQLTVNDGTDTQTLWTGWIQKIRPTVGRRGERQVQILCSGAVEFYTAAETQLELQQDKRTDEIIRSLISEVVYPPQLNKTVILDYIGKLDETAVLPEFDKTMELDAGQLTLGYAADNWVRQGGYSDRVQDSYDVYRAIGDITSAERGKFFFNREGKAVFLNRGHFLRFYEPEAQVIQFDDTMQGLDYIYAGPDQLKNDIIVIAHPRTISATNTEKLWELGDSVIKVKANDTREIYVKYEDENDTRVGAKDVSVTDLEQEEGVQYGTATVTVEEKANGANLIFKNDTELDAYVTNAVVQGQKITDRGMMEARSTDTLSAAKFGRRTLRINLPSLDSLDQAESIADYELARRKDPRGHVASMTLKSPAVGIPNTAKWGDNTESNDTGDWGDGSKWHSTLHVSQLNKSIGDFVRIRETQTGHEAGYFIIGEAHTLQAGLFTTQWYLEPEPPYYPALLDKEGRRELDSPTTVLSY